MLKSGHILIYSYTKPVYEMFIFQEPLITAQDLPILLDGCELEDILRSLNKV